MNKILIYITFFISFLSPKYIFSYESTHDMIEQASYIGFKAIALTIPDVDESNASKFFYYYLNFIQSISILPYTLELSKVIILKIESYLFDYLNDDQKDELKRVKNYTHLCVKLNSLINKIPYLLIAPSAAFAIHLGININYDRILRSARNAYVSVFNNLNQSPVHLQGPNVSTELSNLRNKVRNIDQKLWYSPRISESFFDDKGNPIYLNFLLGGIAATLLVTEIYSFYTNYKEFKQCIKEIESLNINEIKETIQNEIADTDFSFELKNETLYLTIKNQ